MSNASIVDRIRTRMKRLNSLQLDEVDRLVSRLLALSSRQSGLVCEFALDWPHAPLHRLSSGLTMVTGSTLHKEHLFSESNDLDLLQSKLLMLAKQWKWQLEAWACFSNHYHFVARPEEGAGSLELFLQQLHSQTASELNTRKNVNGRTVWFNYFETALTYHNSYMARLNYVHQNAVHHRLVPIANQYKWCSAAWFEQTAKPSQVKTVYSFKTDRVNVRDDFDLA